MKACKKCGLEKALECFYLHSKMKDGRLNQCKACRDAYVLQWAQSNVEKRRRIGRDSATRKRSPERSKATFGKWYSAAYADPIGRAKMLARVAARRAAKLSATPHWANLFFIEEAYDLAQRRTAATGILWEVDHVVPLQSDFVCGLHVENNLRVIPASANRGKRNRFWPSEPVVPFSYFERRHSGTASQIDN